MAMARSAPFAWANVGRIALGAGLLAFVPAMMPISDRIAGEVAERNALARVERQRLDAAGLYRCPDEGPPSEHSPRPSASRWQIIFHYTFSNTIELRVDRGHLEVVEWEPAFTSIGHAQSRASLGRQTHQLPSPAKEAIEALLENALRTAQPVDPSPLMRDGSGFLVRRNDGGCATMRIIGEPTRGMAIRHLLHRVAGNVWGGEGITGAEAQAFAAEARRLMR